MRVVTGRCHCGAVSYVAEGPPERCSLCHCTDCARSSGAPVVGWAMYAEGALTVTGALVSYESSPGTVRQFCGRCGSGLFYRNQAIFPGKVDVQTGTLDDSDAVPPTARLQLAEAPHWFEHVGELPAFERFPG